jgi:hypothetical protein
MQFNIRKVNILADLRIRDTTQLKTDAVVLWHDWTLVREVRLALELVIRLLFETGNFKIIGCLVTTA